MKHTNLDEWKQAAADRGYTVKQTQGYEHYEALDGDRVVGTWVAEHGHLDDGEPDSDSEPTPILDHTGDPLAADPIRYGDEGPVVTENDVTNAKVNP